VPSCVGKEDFELFVGVRAGEAHPLHAEIDWHGVFGEFEEGRLNQNNYPYVSRGDAVKGLEDGRGFMVIMG
jgi:hypothetical protein